MDEIKALWRRLRLFGSDKLAPNGQLLERRIAYWLQEIESRKVDRNLVDWSTRRIEAILETGKARKLDRDIRLMPGTVLTNEYQGVEHRVTVAQNG